jgi:hypothetical protein
VIVNNVLVYNLLSAYMYEHDGSRKLGKNEKRRICKVASKPTPTIHVILGFNFVIVYPVKIPSLSSKVDKC